MLIGTYGQFATTSYGMKKLRPQHIRGQYLDYAVDMSETENENDIDKDSSDDTIS
jgi:hypothetical protein